MMHDSRLPPDYRPLQRALMATFGDDAAPAAEAFWFVGFRAGPHDVGALRVYEHGATGRRVALAPDGSAFRCPDDDRVAGRMDVAEALVDALA